MSSRCFLALMCGLAVQATGAVIQAGFAERDITPDIGQERPGGYRKAFHRTFNDPCKVRAAVFNDGTHKIALVGLDALMVPRSVVLAARAEMARTSGIAAEAVMIGASHSHSSGPVTPEQTIFAGAAYDNLWRGMEAATRSANRVAGQIDVA
jgi:hypothetical protein